jgi:hypothetical protein
MVEASGIYRISGYRVADNSVLERSISPKNPVLSTPLHRKVAHNLLRPSCLHKQNRQAGVPTNGSWFVGWKPKGASRTKLPQGQDAGATEQSGPPGMEESWAA